MTEGLTPPKIFAATQRAIKIRWLLIIFCSLVGMAWLKDCVRSLVIYGDRTDIPLTTRRFTFFGRMLPEAREVSSWKTAAGWRTTPCPAEVTEANRNDLKFRVFFRDSMGQSRVADYEGKRIVRGGGDWLYRDQVSVYQGTWSEEESRAFGTFELWPLAGGRMWSGFRRLGMAEQTIWLVDDEFLKNEEMLKNYQGPQTTNTAAVARK